MNISYKTFGAGEKLPEGVIFPAQTHSVNISEIITGQEDLSEVDGVWSRFTFPGLVPGSLPLLGIKTADCAPIVFWDHEKYGVVHAGWRGLVDGIVEKMLQLVDANTVHFYVGPMLPVFEIQRDGCYEAIKNKFGTAFFIEKQGKVYFQFRDALASLVPGAEFDPRSTFENKCFSSWRRDQSDLRNATIVSFG